MGLSRDYEAAIRCLNSRKERAKATLDGMRGSDDMEKWLHLIGHSEEELRDLNIIHVAGTNGKGSTCTFITSLLLVHREDAGYPSKVGLYTSPHMRNIRERICINGKPITEELFRDRFFEVWDRLPRKATPDLDVPRYLQLLALLAFHVFIEEKVDVAIFETHCGGEYDATNIIKKPRVTAITSVQRDHERLLGPGIEKIAWHKAGIFKSGSPAFSSLQEAAVTGVLQDRAGERRVSLEFVGPDAALPNHIEALNPEVQRLNCSLAVSVVRAWLVAKSCCDITNEAVIRGIERFSCPGRFQQIIGENIRWFLDGAHNETGLRAAADWFSGAISDIPRMDPAPIRILLFSHFSDRNSEALLKCLAESLQKRAIELDHVIFCGYNITAGYARIDRNLINHFSAEVQQKHVETWKKFRPAATIWPERTIKEALLRARAVGGETKQVLITGSLHLASGALELLESSSLELGIPH